VRPNADYVYSPVAIDLSHENVDVTLPNITDGRSYVFPFYDLYGENFANLGSVVDSPPGKYLVRLDHACEPGLVMGHDEFPQYLGVISFPTTWGSMMIRIVTFNNGTDLEAVLQIESQIDIKPLSRPGPPNGPALTPETLQGSSILNEAALKSPWGLDITEVTVILTLMAAIEEYSGPENGSDYGAVKEMFGAAGFSGGVYTPPPGLNLTLASLIIEKNTSTALSTPSCFINLGNSWKNLVPSLCGDFHSHYIFRAYTAYIGYLDLVSTQAIYPEYVVDGTNELSVTMNESYIMRFSGKPPTAFWSLTPYADNYLIPNGLNRYSLHEQSNITYPDGSLVYGGENTTDRPFEILLQAANVAPPTNWTSNWLPAPAGGGNFSVNLRAYGPTAALSNASYVYPIVTKLSA
ncbi:hypothetical protein NA56DRAFT_526367, partial [Hyaloscypha hepaticicola]